MKKTILIMLALCVGLAVPCGVFAQERVERQDFETIRIPFPEDIADNLAWQTVARFADSGQAITLSCYYDG